MLSVRPFGSSALIIGFRLLSLLALLLLFLVPFAPSVGAMELHSRASQSLPRLLQLDLESYPRPRSVFGLHDTPILGGSLDVPTAIQHWQTLGVGSVTVLDPRPELLAAAREADIMVIARVYSGSAYESGDLEGVTRRMVQYGFRYVVPFNEPNLRLECGGAQPDPMGFARRWMTAAEAIERNGGYPVLTPLAPVGDYADDRYYAAMLGEIVRLRGAQWLLDLHAAVGVHAYEVPGQDYRSILQRYAQATRDVVGTTLPLLATEAGTPPSAQPSPAAADASWARSLAIHWELVKQPLPDYVLAVNIWVYSNRAQGGNDGRWESAAWYAQPGSHSFLHILRDDQTTEYLVQPGDSLEAIAKRFGTTPQGLAAANNLSYPTEVLIGDSLIVPGKPPPLNPDLR